MTSPGHLAFVIAHEVGHIATGDSLAGAPVLHEADGVRDDAVIEQRCGLLRAKASDGRESSLFT